MEANSLVSVTVSSGPEQSGARERQRTEHEAARHRRQAEKPPVSEGTEPERQDRWKRKEVLGAVAAVVAGVALITLYVLTITTLLLSSSEPSGPAFLSALRGEYSEFLALAVGVAALITPIAMLGGLVGLHARQAPTYGKLGLAGFLVSFIGNVLMLVGSVLFYLSLLEAPRTNEFDDFLAAFLFFEAWVLGTLVGFVLLGVATLRARVLPRWCGSLLIVGGIIGAFWQIVLGLVWLALAYALWSKRDEETHRPTRTG